MACRRSFNKDRVDQPSFIGHHADVEEIWEREGALEVIDGYQMPGITRSNSLCKRGV